MSIYILCPSSQNSLKNALPSFIILLRVSKRFLSHNSNLVFPVDRKVTTAFPRETQMIKIWLVRRPRHIKYKHIFSELVLVVFFEKWANLKIPETLYSYPTI